MAPRHVTEFVRQLTPMAVEIGDRYGIDPALIITQAAIESGWGEKVSGNNYFGVKSHGQPGGQTITTHEEINGQRVKVQDDFRVYDSLAGSMEDYAKFLSSNPRYGDVFKTRDLNKQVEAIANSGYATDSKYPGLLRDVSRMVTREMGPMPPSQVPNTVATQTDTTPKTRDVPSPRPRPAQRPDIMHALTPKMIPQGVNYPFLPEMTNTSVTRGFGSLTPNAVQETMPSEIPQSAMLPNTRPANVPLPRPRPGMPVVPYDQGQTIATVPTPQRQSLPPLPPSAVTPKNSSNSPISPTGPGPTSLATVQDMYGRPPRPSRLDPIGAGPNSLASVQDMYGRPGGVGQPPATRSVPSVPVPASPAMGITADRGAMPTRSAFLSEFGLANPRETLAAPLPTTAVPGPNNFAKGNERLLPPPRVQIAGLDAVPSAVPTVGTALDVVPNAGFPPMPRPRPVPFSMPTPMGQRPTLPMPSANPFAMPTPAAQRPNPNALRVTVNGAGSYNAPQRAAPTPTREQMLAAILARSRGPTAFGHGGTIDGAVQPIGTLSGRR